MFPRCFRDPICFTKFLGFLEKEAAYNSYQHFFGWGGRNFLLLEGWVDLHGTRMKLMVQFD